jgi:hypothetical protein
MALSSSYVNVYGRLGDVFQRIGDGQAPDKFTTQYLKDLGFTSTNFRAVIPLLKSLSFLTADGTPTVRYHEYRNAARGRRVMGEALREAYGDLFTIKAKPTEADFPLIEGKFKSVHNASTNTAKLMANTFFALLELADLPDPNAFVAPAEQKDEAEDPPGNAVQPIVPPVPKLGVNPSVVPAGTPRSHSTLHYNIQIHLPATKDVEVFNAIFKSLKEHLLD